MKRLYVLTLIAAALTACAAAQTVKTTNYFVSDKVNDALPPWLRVGFEDRVRLESISGLGFKSGAEDSYVLNRLRLNVSVLPVEWMSFRFEGQDARVWGYSQGPAPASMRNSMDLRQAYFELGGRENARYSVRVGRQAMVFGEGRLVADPVWSTGRAFEAVRVTVQNKRVRLDAFASSVVKAKDGEFDWNTGADNFHGVYGSIRNAIPQSTIEPFGFWRLARGLKSENGKIGNQDTKTLGVRWVGKLPLRLDYNVEIARQFGLWSTDTVSAWAGHWVLGRTLTQAQAKPRVYVEYNYATGDNDPKDGRRGTFDQLYPSAHDKFGMVDQVMWSNIRHVRGAFEYNVSRKMAVKTGYHSFWLANARDGLYTGGKLVARVADGSAGTHMGQELDCQILWNFSPTGQINAGYGRLIPGKFIIRALPGASYNQFFMSVAHVF